LHGRGLIALALSASALAVPAGCALNNPVTPTPSATASPSSPASTPTVTPSATTSAPSVPSATTSATTASVKATGSLALFSDVSTSMTGTCQVVDGVPTITLTDGENDFFGTVEVTIRLNSGRDALASFVADLGEDSENIARQISYDASSPARGTSAKLVISGQTFQLAGQAANREDGKDAGTIPYSIRARCSSPDW